jgi:DNA-binding response OmpR family regulator
MKKTVLLLESDSELRKAIAMHLEGQQWRVLQSKTLDFAIQMLDKESPHVLISELDSPYQMNGILIDRFRERNNNHSGKVVVLALEHLKSGIVERYHPDVLIYKPFDIRYLSKKMEALFKD